MCRQPLPVTLPDRSAPAHGRVLGADGKAVQVSNNFPSSTRSQGVSWAAHRRLWGSPVVQELSKVRSAARGHDMSILGGAYYGADRSAETEVERLKRQLREAEEEIARLRRKLGSNHPDGYQSTS
jgi:hypothetical protein